MNTAVILVEFLKASGRLWMLLWHSRPDRGFPIVRAAFATLEAISLDPRAEVVGPPLRELMAEINLRAPGAVRVAMRDEPGANQPPSPPRSGAEVRRGDEM